MRLLALLLGLVVCLALVALTLRTAPEERRSAAGQRARATVEAEAARARSARHALPSQDATAAAPPAVEDGPEAAVEIEEGSGPRRSADGQPADRSDPAAGGRQRVDLHRAMREAAELGRAARAGDAAAAKAVAERLASEPDPRIRTALRDGEVPPAGRISSHATLLPEPAAAAAPEPVQVFWVVPDDGRGTYHSAVSIAPDGRATVETTATTNDGTAWRVRHGAWAYRDAAGNLVLDARGQEVDVIERPPWGWWSPDSMVIRPNGLVESIDDKFDPGSGTTGARGPG